MIDSSKYSLFLFFLCNISREKKLKKGHFPKELHFFEKKCNFYFPKKLNFEQNEKKGSKMLQGVF